IIPVKKFNACRIEDLVYEEIYRDRTYIYFVVFERGEKTDIDCDEFFYPETDLGSLEKEKDDFRSLRQEKIKILRSFFNRLDEVEEYCSQLESEYAFLNVSANLNNAVEGTVNIINGWVPSSAKNRIEKFLQEQNAYFYFAKPQAGEPVPILLKNNWFSRLFEPITKMFSLPHYAELDLTAFFAPFFTLFFGLCLGDAGYGLLIFFAALFAHFKLSEDKKPIAKLIMILGVSTCIFGVLTGTFFGIPLVEIEIFRKIVLLDQTRIFYGALILGVIQIIYGMCIKALNRIRMYGFMSSLSTFGWIFLVAGLTRLVAGTIAELPKAQWAVLCLYFGVVLILLFNDLKANIFIRIGKGLWELYGITGVFGDVLSYIRLFALGVSSAILGLVFNDIAFQCKTIPVIGFFVTFMLLVILHGINLALSALSSFVHPLRLTFVEFYKSAGFEGGGKAYDPFRQIKVK
ncbi:MAG: V-type ATP synthase subunit I, partial [Candidatus Omnitrophica bacterium]|nr:V-type ATP synthase subunit I [Candidatus Omnitrophota bacterium]